MKPKVSIVMPVLNGEKYIGEAIGSILAQTFSDFELVVIDDGSTDRTPELIEEFRAKMRVTCVRHDRCQGITRSVNDALRHAAGEYISFLDHDDLWFPEFLETQVRYMEQHPEVGMVHSDFQTVDAHGNVLESSVAACRNRGRPSGRVFAELFQNNFIVANSVLIRKKCFDRLGTFDEALRWGDYHMWLRIAREYRIDYMDKVLTKYRQHSNQGSREASTRDPNQDPVPLQAIKRLVAQYPEIRQELGDTTVRRRMGSFYFDHAYAWYLEGARKDARIVLRKALRSWPTNRRYISLYLACLLPPSLVSALRGNSAQRRQGNRPAELRPS
jgi:glycosyltransferase involved in cell wall biosynthesis